MRYIVVYLCFFAPTFFLVAQEHVDTIDITENCFVDYIPFDIVEKAPVYSGCTGNDNNTLKECFSNSISKFVIKNFKLKDKFNENYGHETIRMFARFIVNKDGKIIDVKVRALNESFEKEVIRVIEKLPQMTPGKQKGKSVAVLYNFPIIFDLK